MGITGIESADMTIDSAATGQLKWSLCGAYQTDTGIFVLRHGEA